MTLTNHAHLLQTISMQYTVQLMGHYMPQLSFNISVSGCWLNITLLSDEWGERTGGDTGRGNCLIANSLTQMPTRNVLGSSPDIYGERPETKCLKNGMAQMGRSSFSTEGDMTSTQPMQDLYQQQQQVRVWLGSNTKLGVEKMSWVGQQKDRGRDERKILSWIIRR